MNTSGESRVAAAFTYRVTDDGELDVTEEHDLVFFTDDEVAEIVGSGAAYSDESVGEVEIDARAINALLEAARTASQAEIPRGCAIGTENGFGQPYCVVLRCNRCIRISQANLATGSVTFWCVCVA
jgi:hypothetical protein